MVSLNSRIPFPGTSLILSGLLHHLKVIVNVKLIEMYLINKKIIKILKNGFAAHYFRHTCRFLINLVVVCAAVSLLVEKTSFLIIVYIKIYKDITLSLFIRVTNIKMKQCYNYSSHNIYRSSNINI